jgi:ATP-dependent Clp protease ATP-binding subunit ClpC
MSNSQTLDEKKIFEKFTQNAKKCIIKSYDLARKDSTNKENVLDVKYLFASILLGKNSFASRVLAKLKIDMNKTVAAILGPKENFIFRDASIAPDEKFKQVIAEAYMESATLGHVYVGTEHLLLALMKRRELPYIEELWKNEFNYERIKKEILKMGSYQPGVFGGEETGDLSGDGDDQSAGAKLQAQLTGESDKQSALDFFGRNMCEEAKNGRYLPIHGREDEIERLFHILSRQTKNNPILVGESGVGKTAIVEGLAQRMVKKSKKVPSSFRNYEIIQIDISSIIAGAKIRGDVEERLMAIMKEIEKSDDKIIFIDEIHMVVGSGSTTGTADIANIIKPYLTSNKIKFIGATTSDEYTKYFESDKALARRFQPVNVEEIEPEEALEVVKYLKPVFENYHKVTITDESLKEAVRLSHRYVTDRYLPDKAIDVIDESAAKKKLIRERKNKSVNKLESGLADIEIKKNKALNKGDLDLASELRVREVDFKDQLKKQKKKSQSKSMRYKVEIEDIREVISRWTKIPVISLSSMDIKNIAQIDEIIKTQIIGQESAIDKVSAALKRARLGFAEENRPLASFLFLGPTGVGKTETAKVIAKELFGSQKNLIQVNMSEFMEQHSVSKIIGSPPGYVGYQDSGNLTEEIRKNPFSIVLFDEIEKAHSDILNILLQALEEGYIQDSRGKKVSFKNTIIVMTSNIGAKEIADDKVLGFEVDLGSKASDKKLDEVYEDMKKDVMEELKDNLRPEFINRIDDVIVYRGLNKEDILKITDLQIDKLNDRLKKKGIVLRVRKSVKDKIAEEGYSKEYGARNIKRKVQELIENRLADFLLERDMVEELQKRQRKGIENSGLLQITVQIREDEVVFDS